MKIAKFWIKEGDLDGFRLDVYKHVSPKFWDRFFPEIREYARALGKGNFMLAGELYDGDPHKLKPEVGIGKLYSAYNYPAYYWNLPALHGDAPTRALEDNFNALRGVLGQSLDYLLHFLDNHDRPRFLRQHDAVGILKVAMSFVLTSVGIPYIYYATEQAVRRVAGREKLDLEESRDDQFPGGLFKGPSVADDGFDRGHPMFQHLKIMNQLRKDLPALRRGEQYVRWSDHKGPGIFAFSRIYDGQEVLVAINTSAEPREAEMFVDNDLTPAGARLVDAVAGDYTLKTEAKDGGSKATVQVPGHGVRVLIRSAKP
jgi:neopullulanase